MTNRRQFLEIGLAASALPLAAGAAHALGARGEDGFDAVPLYKILYDVRFPASVTFARRAAQWGVPTHAISGDMTRFWYDDLYHRWAQGPAAIAGLTGHGALFCLERLAWDHRMRVVFRGEHTVAATGSIAHAFAGPSELLPAACRVADEADWAAGMADVVAQCPRDRTATATARAVSAAGRVRLLESEPLFSWVIAPVARVSQ